VAVLASMSAGEAVCHLSPTQLARLRSELRERGLHREPT
jgi:hypothetical protein